jgi:hypothetical protein
MSDEACGLWVEVWISIICEELPRLSRAIANIRAFKPNRLTDAERKLVRSVSENSMVGGSTALLMSQSCPRLSFTSKCWQMRSVSGKKPDKRLERSSALRQEKGGDATAVTGLGTVHTA